MQVLAILYFSFFLLGGVATTLILNGLRINEMFKQGKVFHIKLFFVVTTLVVAHIFGSIAYRIGSFYIN